METTLEKIRNENPCKGAYKHFRSVYPDLEMKDKVTVSMVLDCFCGTYRDVYKVNNPGYSPEEDVEWFVDLCLTRKQQQVFMFMLVETIEQLHIVDCPLFIYYARKAIWDLSVENILTLKEHYPKPIEGHNEMYYYVYLTLQDWSEKYDELFNLECVLQDIIGLGGYDILIKTSKRFEEYHQNK